MTMLSAPRRLSLIASQIEAASTLLKFSADDLKDLVDDNSTIFANELSAIVSNLHAQAAILDGNSVFLTRTDLGDGAPFDEADADPRQWIA